MNGGLECVHFLYMLTLRWNYPCRCMLGGSTGLTYRQVSGRIQEDDKQRGRQAVVGLTAISFDAHQRLRWKEIEMKSILGGFMGRSSHAQAGWRLSNHTFTLVDYIRKLCCAVYPTQSEDLGILITNRVFVKMNKQLNIYFLDEKGPSYRRMGKKDGFV